MNDRWQFLVRIAKLFKQPLNAIKRKVYAPRVQFNKPREHFID